MTLKAHIRVQQEGQELYKDLLQYAELCAGDTEVFAFYVRMCQAVSTDLSSLLDEVQIRGLDGIEQQNK